MFRNIVLILSVFILAGCSFKKADIDFDPEFKTQRLKTFAVAYKNENDYEGLNEKRIYDAIVHEIKSKGYEETSKERADFYLTFLIDTKEKIYSDINFGFGVGAFSRRSAVALESSRDLPYYETSLFINSVDSKTQKAFWSSLFALDSLEFKSAQDRIDYFNKTIEKMLEKFPAADIKE
ncbi:MAG: hypothetical protein C0628_00415 [Sulfurimonas sp.]|jgi:hypothetical protein|nr:MAG: hypothetical protein C0628_00415 [Sulfurimonas sp.]